MTNRPIPIIIIIIMYCSPSQVAEYSLEVVCAYMGHIQSCAEIAVRDMLRWTQPSMDELLLLLQLFLRSAAATVTHYYCV
jgi:hypothetical protein